MKNVLFCPVHFAKNKALAFVAVAVLYLVLWRCGVPCTFHLVTGIPCPGCGMTRAFIALAQGHFAEAWRWHPMVYAMPLVVFLIWQNGRLFYKRAYNRVLLGLLGLGFAACWAARLLGFLLPA